MKTLFLSLLISTSVFAGVEAYNGTAGQKLFIEESGGSAFVKFTGVYPEWDNKVIQVKKEEGRLPKYEFEYTEELSSGVKTYTYQLVTVETPQVTKEKSTKRVKLWTPNERKKGTEFLHDQELTGSSQSLDLAGTYKKEKFVPEVE